MKRGTQGVLVLLLLCLLGGTARAAESAGPERIILSWTGDPKTTMTVSWQAEANGPDGWVEYGTSPSLSGAKKISATVAKLTSGIALDAAVEQAALTGLTPGTTYYYRVGNGELKSEIRHFQTAQSEEPSFSFLYMGDVQTGTGEDGKWKSLLETAALDNSGLAFGVLGGDIVDSGISADQWKRVLGSATGVFSQIPMMTTNGNHESNFPGGKPELYLDLMALPQNGPEGFAEEFYSYDYGNCHMLVLNSWVFSGEQGLSSADYQRMNRWIADDLRASDAVWKVVVMHHPVYSLASDKVAAAVKRSWEPLFEANGVSLVLCGHQHVYSRSYPMADGRIDFTDGITYVMGNASQKFYSTADETYQAKTVYNTSTYQVVRVDGNSLTVQSYDGAGNLLDFTALLPRDGQKNFSDVPGEAWYAQAVSAAVSGGLLDETGTETFSPTASATRAMAVSALYRLAGSPTVTGTAPFSDVPASAAYANAAAWAQQTGVSAGTKAGTFQPEKSVTRQELAVLLGRYAEKIGGENTAKSGALSAFSDGGDVSAYARSDFAWAVSNGVIRGTKDGRLMPGAVLSRAQIAVILTRFAEGETGS
ncbi:S-layer homology domain-containing protein [uncultured Oscillibacter sp.]|uniref:S-layer homology domain-containing protein n=1 Tax=uncultured Oscillibacter sp. TaxID=876091 RepID=UPI0025FD87E5|nr:S-layer homology domain-containing protein [uncultured Oscillibacter sp.]